jgi:prepilin-type N-terminal cleavage/methylation domain-containing protein
MARAVHCFEFEKLPPSGREGIVRRNHRGFTLIELMVVVVIIGILAAIAIPNFIAMQDRAKEGSTRANMHAFQVSAEDYGVQYDGLYSDAAANVATLLPASGTNFKNPFSGNPGSGDAWEDRPAILNPASTISGITSYGDSSQQIYQIKGHGKSAALNFVLGSMN